MRRPRLILVLLAGLAVLVAGCSSSGGGSGATPSDLAATNDVGPYQGFGLTPPQPRPSFQLTDTSGKPFSFGTVTRGHPTLLFFGYTNCPDVCPTTMADVSVALKKVKADVAKQTYVVFVTTDVKRDTGPVLAKWLSNFTPGVPAKVIGLTGTQAQIDAAQAAAHVTVAEDDGQTHSSELLLYGSDDYARVAFAQSTKLASQVQHDLPIVAKA